MGSNNTNFFFPLPFISFSFHPRQQKPSMKFYFQKSLYYSRRLINTVRSIAESRYDFWKRLLNSSSYSIRQLSNKFPNSLKKKKKKFYGLITIFYPILIRLANLIEVTNAFSSDNCATISGSLHQVSIVHMYIKLIV